MNRLLLEMQRQRDAIMRWMRQQMRVALFVYPFAIAGGFCWGGVEGSGTDLRTFMSKPAVLSLLLVVIAVLVPLCYFCSKWLFKLWFGGTWKYWGHGSGNLRRERVSTIGRSGVGSLS